jgi:hypothetical protein
LSGQAKRPSNITKLKRLRSELRRLHSEVAKAI